MNQILTTKDQSFTLYSEQFEQTYHSIHGALTESLHVFIRHGLERIAQTKSTISVFEMGYGTGLNAALTWQYAIANHLIISYEGVEKFPVTTSIYEKLTLENSDLQNKLDSLNRSEWGILHSSDNFSWRKNQIDIIHYQPLHKFDIIYFDAFAPNAQPDLWSEIVFIKMYEMLNPNGILTTYCAKGEVKRTLKRCGFTIESPAGPAGKREMTVAVKN